MTFKMHALSGYGLILALALIFSGCAASQQEIMARDHLANARTAYNMAKADPTVAANAPMPLMDAGKTLEAAEQARDFNEMNHLAYMAERTDSNRCCHRAHKSGQREKRRASPRKRSDARAVKRPRTINSGP